MGVDCTRRAVRTGAPRLTVVIVSVLAALATLMIATTSRVVASAPQALFVSNAGDDLNPGTPELPFATIPKAVTAAAAGDTIIVANGTYPGQIAVTKSGLTFRSEHRWGAVIDGNSAQADGFVVATGITNVTIDGFEIRNLRSLGGSSSGIELYNGGDGTTIINNNIHDIGRQCTTVSQGQVAIFVRANNVRIENNYIHDIGRFQMSEGCTSDDRLHDHGIYLNSSNSTAKSGIVVTDNSFFRIDRGWAVQFYPGWFSGPQVTNNRFAHGNPTRQFAHIVIYNTRLTNATFRGNAFYDFQPGKPFTLGGSLTLSNVVVDANTSTGSELTDRVPPSGWVATSNVLNAGIPEPATPTAVNVPPTEAPVVEVTANPSNIVSGSASTLSWSATNQATTCTATGDWGGARYPSGAAATGVLSVPGVYTYTLECSNAVGTGSASASVTVTALPAPVITLAASQSTARTGQRVTLTWSVTNSPGACVAGGDWTGTQRASGSWRTPRLAIVKTYVYTLTCMNAGGSTSRSVSVTVTR